MSFFEKIESNKYSKLKTDDRRWKFELIESYYKWFETHFFDNIHFIDHNSQCDRNKLSIYALMKKTRQIECRINSINKLNCSTTWLSDCKRLIIDRLQKISTRVDLKKKLSKWSCLNEKEIDWNLRKISACRRRRCYLSCFVKSMKRRARLCLIFRQREIEIDRHARYDSNVLLIHSIVNDMTWIVWNEIKRRFSTIMKSLLTSRWHSELIVTNSIVWWTIQIVDNQWCQTYIEDRDNYDAIICYV